jgi:hypothetical protein
MIAAKPQERTCELQQTEVVLRLLVPADEDRSAFREPRQCPFHHSSPRPVSRGPFWTLVADQHDVGLVVVIDAGTPAVLVVVALVETQVPRLAFLNRRAIQHDGLDGRRKELGVRDVGAGYDDRQRATVGLDQDGALHAGLGALGRIGADEVPPSWPCPSR